MAAAAKSEELLHFKEIRLSWLCAARVVAGALAAFGPAKLQFGKLTIRPTVAKAKLATPAGKKHRFVWNGIKWLCLDCCTTKRSDQAWSDHQTCSGKSVMSSLKLENFGHVLWAAKVLDYGGTLIWCRL